MTCAALLLLQWILASAANTVAFAVPPQTTLSPIALLTAVPRSSATASAPADAGVYSGHALVEAHELAPQRAPLLSTRVPPTVSPSSFFFQECTGGTALFACRRRPKKEKALRNYRLAKQQQHAREERAAQRRQQIEIMRARQLLPSSSEINGTNTGTNSTTKTSLFGTGGASTPVEEAGAGLHPALRGHLAARINYRLVGGTWRRATGAGKFVRIPGAQLAAAVFEGLPEEEVAAAIAKAKRQDAGHMDLEAYDESDAQLTTLEGIS